MGSDAASASHPATGRTSFALSNFATKPQPLTFPRSPAAEDSGDAVEGVLSPWCTKTTLLVPPRGKRVDGGKDWH